MVIERKKQMGSYFVCLGKYATFNGRSTRTEFWGYTIVNSIIIFALAYFYINAGKSYQTIATTLFIAYTIISICPSLAAMSRRWHDLGRTGKWLWLNLVPVVGTVVSLFFMLGEGEDGTNEYGRNPRERRYRKRNRNR